MPGFFLFYLSRSRAGIKDSRDGAVQFSLPRKELRLLTGAPMVGVTRAMKTLRDPVKSSMWMD